MQRACYPAACNTPSHRPLKRSSQEEKGWLHACIGGPNLVRGEPDLSIEKERCHRAWGAARFRTACSDFYGQLRMPSNSHAPLSRSKPTQTEVAEGRREVEVHELASANPCTSANSQRRVRQLADAAYAAVRAARAPNFAPRCPSRLPPTHEARCAHVHTPSPALPATTGI